MMKLDLKMTYTYNAAHYTWFRVTVDGVPIRQYGWCHLSQALHAQFRSVRNP
jgi:hypothetical protein